MQRKTPQQQEIGTYIVSDPHICHGEPTFRGTRKLVRDCIEMMADGLTVDELATRSGLPRKAITEALRLAAAVLQDHYSRRLPTSSQAKGSLGVSV